MRFHGTTNTVKTGVALTLAVSLALPLSITTSCSRFTAPNGTVVTTIPAGADSSLYRPVQTRDYVWTVEASPLPRAVLVMCYLWPLPLLAFYRWGRRERVQRLVWWFEPVLAAASGWFVWLVASVLAAPAIGAYRVVIGDALLVGVWLIELVGLRRPEAAGS